MNPVTQNTNNAAAPTASTPPSDSKKSPVETVVHATNLGAIHSNVTAVRVFVNISGPAATASAIKRKKKKNAKAAASKKTDECAQKQDESTQKQMAQSLGVVSVANISEARYMRRLTSFFKSPLLPPISPAEKEILTGIFQRSLLNSSLCLIDVFGLDLMIHWNALISTGGKYGTIPKALTLVKEQFFCSYLLSFLYFIGKHPDDAPPYKEALLSTKFFRTEKAMAEDLILRIQNLELALESLALNYVRNKPKTSVERFRYNNHEKYIGELKSLIVKLSLFLKIYQHSPDACALLVKKSLYDYEETQVMNQPTGKHIPHLLKFNQFITELITISLKNQIFGIDLSFVQKLDKFFAEIAKTGISQKLIDMYNQAYVAYSVEVGKLTAQHETWLRSAILDPTFTHERFCREQQIHKLADHSQKEFIAQLYNRTLSLELFDFWLDDYQEIISTCSFTTLGPRNYRPSTECIVRLITNFNYLHNPPKVINSDSKEEFLAPLDIMISKYMERINAPIYASIKKIDLSVIENEISRILAAPRITLSIWQHCFHSLAPIVEVLQPLCREIFLLHKEVLTIIREANTAGKLGQWKDSKLLKAELQKIIKNHCEYSARMFMMLNDVMALYHGKVTSDVLHLFPDEVIQFFELEGFNEILVNEATQKEKVEIQAAALVSEVHAEAPKVVEAAASTVIVAETILVLPSEVAPGLVIKPLRPLQVASTVVAQPKVIPNRREFLHETMRRKEFAAASETVVVQKQPPLMTSVVTAANVAEKMILVSKASTSVPAAKSQAQPPAAAAMYSHQNPERSEFVRETKRRNIMKILKQYGFESERTKGSHEILSNTATGRVAVVPLGLEAPGTRMSIYNQAFATSTSTDFKAGLKTVTNK